MVLAPCTFVLYWHFECGALSRLSTPLWAQFNPMSVGGFCLFFCEQIFDGLNKAYRNVEGRMTAKQIEDRYGSKISIIMFDLRFMCEIGLTCETFPLT